MKVTFTRSTLFVSIISMTLCSYGADLKTIVYLVRHGQTDWNAAQQSQVFKLPINSDLSINATGMLQVKKLAETLKDTHFDLCISSDLKRAYETAKILGESRSQCTLIPDPRLRERDVSQWEGRLMSELIAADDDQKNEIETDTSMNKRINAFLNDVVLQFSGKSILTVTHGGVIRIILTKIVSGSSLENTTIKNAAFFKIAYINEQWQLEDTQKIEFKT